MSIIDFIIALWAFASMSSMFGMDDDDHNGPAAA